MLQELPRIDARIGVGWRPPIKQSHDFVGWNISIKSPGVQLSTAFNLGKFVWTTWARDEALHGRMIPFCTFIVFPEEKGSIPFEFRLNALEFTLHFKPVTQVSNPARCPEGVDRLASRTPIV